MTAAFWATALPGQLMQHYLLVPRPPFLAGAHPAAWAHFSLKYSVQGICSGHTLAVRRLRIFSSAFAFRFSSFRPTRSITNSLSSFAISLSSSAVECNVMVNRCSEASWKNNQSVLHQNKCLDLTFLLMRAS